MSNERVNIFIIQIEYTANKNRQTLSQPKPWCNDGGILNLHHANDVKEVVLSQPSVTWYKSTTQKTGIRTVYEIWIINLIRPFVVQYRWVFLRVVRYFDEPIGRLQIQTTSKNSQRYHKTKGLIIQHAKLLCPCGYGECVTKIYEAERNWRGKPS